MMFQVLHFVAVSQFAAQSQPSIWTLSSAKGVLSASFIDPVTGVQTPGGSGAIATAFPPRTGCTWTAHNMRSTTYFEQNASLFVLVEETCEGVSGRTNTSVITVRAPSPPFDPKQKPEPLVIYRPVWYSRVQAFLAVDVKRWNLAWDSVCNVVVLAPTQVGSSIQFNTLVVSEYDGEVRPRAPLLIEEIRFPMTTIKVDGFAVLQSSGVSSGWPLKAQCHECGFYTLEHNAFDGVAQAQRFLIGRDFTTAKLLSNVTDAFNIMTLSAPSPRAFASAFANRSRSSTAAPLPFVGIGACDASQAWSAVACAAHDGELVLLAFDGAANTAVANNSPYPLAFLGKGGNEAERAATVKLGVVLSPLTYALDTPGVFARLLVAGSVVSYVVTPAKAASSSPLIAHSNGTAPLALKTLPQMWQHTQR